MCSISSTHKYKGVLHTATSEFYNMRIQFGARILTCLLTHPCFYIHFDDVQE
jgi:hypothetical protein